MGAEVIKSFLIGLGFGVDEASLTRFNKAIQSASVKIAALYAGIQVAASGIFYGISKISEGFEQMGYEYRLIAPAFNKAIVLRQALLQAYREAGVNLTKVIQQSILFNLSLQKTKFAFQAIAGSVASKFFPLLTKQMDIFRSKIYSNMPKIQHALAGFVSFIFSAFDGTVHLGQTVWSILSRVYDFFVMLDHATDGWSTKILMVLAAWKLLNLEFLATPLGLLLAGLTALLVLYDDFKTWQEGGKSLFDWSDALPAIENIRLLFTSIFNLVKGIGQVLWGINTGNLGPIEEGLKRIEGVFESINLMLDRIVKSFHVGWIDKLLEFRNTVNTAVLGGNNGAPVGGYMNPSYFATPIGAGGNSSQSTINNHQTNNVNVSGVSDPNAAAAATTHGINQVTADVFRNGKAPAK